MHANIVRQAAVSSLVSIAEKLVDAGHARDGSHALLAALRITLDVRMSLGKDPTKLPQRSTKPMDSLVTLCRQKGILAPAWLRLIRRYTKSPSSEHLYLDDDFRQLVKVIEIMQREIDQLSAKAQKRTSDFRPLSEWMEQGKEVTP